MRLDSVRKYALALEAVTLHSEFVDKFFWGEKVLGLRVNLPPAKARVVKYLILNAYNKRVNKNAGPKMRSGHEN
jgi:hypothetical protein